MSNKSLPHQTVPNLTLSPNATRVAKEETKIDPLDELAGLRRKLLGENEIRAEINGVLTFRIVKMILLELERGPVLKQSCYCSISVVNLTKNTHVASKDAGCVTWNQTKHFSVQIPVNRRHPFNLVKLQFFEVPSANPSCARRIGLVSLHLHDIISASPVSGIFEVWDENHLIGDVALEITFNYGVFGYGYATQLKEEKRSTDEMIMYSLFPRINPGEDQLDPDTGVLNIQSTPHPSYIPFKEKVYLSYGKELEEESKKMAGKEYIPDTVCKDFSILSPILEKYYSINDRVARLTYLQNLLQSDQLRKEALLDQTDTEKQTITKVHPDYVQPYNLPITIDDDVVFDALSKFRSDLSDSQSSRFRSRKSFFKMKSTREPSLKGNIKFSKLDEEVD